MATKKTATKTKSAPKTATKKKATTKSSAAKDTNKKDPAAKKPAAKKATATKKAAVKKPAAKKAATKKAAPAKKAAEATTKKAATKKAAPAKKAATKKAAKASAPDAAATAQAKAPKKAATKKAPTKKAKGKKAEAEPKAQAKKLNVGQKPRGGKSEAILVPSSVIQAKIEGAAAATAPIPSTTASKEAKEAFRVNENIVYPAHGVGKIVAIEKQVIAGITNELFLIAFDQEKLRLKVPTGKAIAVGMRKLTDEKALQKAIDLLKGRARIKRTMWSRRAQEYEAKINSGDINALAEVVRDLFRAADQPEQSYSERQLFEAALDRLAREVAAVRKVDLDKAVAELEASLAQKKAA